MAEEEGGSQGLELEIDGEKQVFTPEKVQELLNERANLTKSSQEASVIRKAAERYETDPETYVAQAEGSFALVSKLIDEGFIDEQGNRVKKGEEPGKLGGSDLPPRGPAEGGRIDDTRGLVGDEKVAAIVHKAVSNAVAPYEAEIAALKSTQSRMLRGDIETQIKSKHPELTSRDITHVISEAMNDRSIDLWKHAEATAQTKVEDRKSLKRELAKEMGIDDLDEWEKKNQMKEQESKGGLGFPFKGKKMSFRGGKDAVTPREAMIEARQKGLL